MKWRIDIQALRAIAVLGVVLFHAGVPLIDGGFAGVDVFFVVSGFLITGMLFPSDNGPNRTIPAFLTSRVRRLLPPSVVTLVIVTIVTWLTIDPLLRAEIFKEIRNAALQISNITMAIASNDYLAGDAEDNPVMHFWTLGLEWQYYILWAILVGICIILFRKSIPVLKVALTALLVVLFVTTLAASIIRTPEDPGPSYFLLSTRAWEFSIGGLAFIVGPWIAKRLGTTTRGTLVVAGMVGIIASFFVISTSTTFPGYAALLPTLATAIVIVAGTEPLSKGLTRPIENRVVQRLGATSYSWYLWHWPFLVFPSLWWDQQPLWANLAFVAISYLAAEASYRFVEQPARYRIPSLKKPLLALPVAVVCIVATAGLGWALKSAPSPASGDPTAVAQATKLAKDYGQPYKDGCHRGLNSTDTNPCYYGDKKNSNKTVVLWGDSHAAQWFDAMNEMAKEKHLRLAYYTKSGCSPVELNIMQLKDPTAYPTCAKWADQTQAKILASKPELVVMGMHSNRKSWAVPAAGDPAARVPGLKDGDTEGAVGLRKRMIDFNAAKQPTVILVDNPSSPTNIPRCVSRHGLNSTQCDWDLPAKNGATEEAAARGLEYVHVVDLNRYLCPGGRCKAVIDGTMTMRDGDHLSGPFTSSLAGRLSEALQPYLR